MYIAHSAALRTEITESVDRQRWPNVRIVNLAELFGLTEYREEMGDGQEPASAEPVVEAGPAAPEGPVPRLSPEALDQFNNLANDPVARAKCV